MFQRIISNERNQRIRQHPTEHTFWVQAGSAKSAVRYRGVAAIIQHRFGKGQHRRTSGTHLQRQRKRFKGWTKCMKRGHQHGTSVHRQIAQVVKTQHDLRAKNTDGCVLKVFEWMKNHEWIVIDSEIKIWDEHIRCATAIDAICYDTHTKQLILVEWKTGYLRQQWLNQNGPFRRHALQVALAQVILEKSYGIPQDKISSCVFLINQRVNISQRFVNTNMKKEALLLYESLKKR